MLTLVGGPTSKAQESFHSDLGDDLMMPVGIEGMAAQEPRLRLTFRDTQGRVQHSTLLSTYRPDFGPSPEARKQQLRQAMSACFSHLGLELIDLEVVTTQPFSF